MKTHTHIYIFYTSTKDIKVREREIETWCANITPNYLSLSQQLYISFTLSFYHSLFLYLSLSVPLTEATFTKTLTDYRLQSESPYHIDVITSPQFHQKIKKRRQYKDIKNN
jgi:hypothetical protein